MHSSSIESDDLGKVPFGGALLTGGLITSLVLFFMAVLGPEQFMTRPLAIMLWCAGTAFTVAIIDILGYLLRIPLLIGGITFVVSQWLGLWGRIWMATQTLPPFIFNPLPVLKSDWLWCLLIAVVWGAVLGFHRILARLSRIPKSLTVKGDVSNSELNYRLILIQWQKDWQIWRLVIILLMGISILFFSVQFPVMRATTELRRIMIGLFFTEAAAGLLLLTAGFFYYKRACWKVEGVEPDPGFKTIWYQAFAILFGGMALFCGIIPADYGRPDEWWARLLTLISRNPTGPVPKVVNQINWIEKGMFQYSHINTTSPSMQWIVKIIFIIAIGIPLLLVLICIFVLAGYLCARWYPSFAGELDHLRGLPKVLIKFYLYWMNLWQSWRSRIGAGGKRKKEDTEIDYAGNSPSGKKNIAHSWGRGPQAIIRRGYYRMVDMARSRGFGWQPSQTPQDIATGLNGLLPDEEKAIREITVNYQQARYGPSEPPPEKVLLFERLRRTLERQLRLLIK
jgi:hypothetical protein